MTPYEEMCAALMEAIELLFKYTDSDVIEITGGDGVVKVVRLFRPLDTAPSSDVE